MPTNNYSTTLVEDSAHTAENPYCGDPGCWCHTDTDYHEYVHEPEYDEETLETAYRFYGLTR